MYGEKTEENEELKMDLQDVKEMYKLQVKMYIFIESRTFRTLNRSMNVKWVMK